MAEPHDPGYDPEEGLPDAQDEAPEAELASDPEWAPLPMPPDAPAAAESFGTTTFEQEEGEPLDERLAAEEPDVGDDAEPPGESFTLDEDRGPETEADLEEELDEDGIPDEETGLLTDDPDPAGVRNQDLFSHRDPAEDLSAEEEAMHIPEDQDSTGGT